jgi:hypothetical protein
LGATLTQLLAGLIHFSKKLTHFVPVSISIRFGEVIKPFVQTADELGLFSCLSAPRSRPTDWSVLFGEFGGTPLHSLPLRSGRLFISKNNHRACQYNENHCCNESFFPHL